MSEHFPTLFGLMAEVVMRPRFAPQEIERVRRQRLGLLHQSLTQPTYAATRAFRLALFGQHPYGHLPLGEVAATEKISRQDLAGYFARNYGPANASLVITGDISMEAAMRLAQNTFGLWRSSAKTTAVPPVPPPAGPQLLLIDRPGSSQSTLVVGRLGASRTDPDYEALNVLNSILGGAFNSRLNMNLREDKGYTYGAFSRLGYHRQRGSFEVHTRVRQDVTGAALAQIFAEMQTIGAADVSDEELSDAKSRYILALPAQFQTLDAIARQFASLTLHKLPVDQFDKLPQAVAQVSKEQVRALAQGYCTSDQLIVVVMGDAATVLPQLQALQRGEVRRIDATGASVAADGGH